MNLNTTEQFAKDTMAEYAQKYPELNYYSFSWIKSTRSIGRCNYRTRKVSLSCDLIPAIADESIIIDTVLHEIAHVVAGPGTGHGFIWQQFAKIIGAKPERCQPFGAIDETKVARYNWFFVCPNCNLTVGTVRRPKRLDKACPDCCNIYSRGKYDSRFKFIFIPATQHRDILNQGLSVKDVFQVQ